jgi:hypothetical protein
LDVNYINWLKAERKFLMMIFLFHHIYHSPATGKILYWVDYETINCLVALKGDKENKQVKGADWKKYQDRFIYMWDQLKKGNFKEATKYWGEQYQNEFLIERRSHRFLNY